MSASANMKVAGSIGAASGGFLSRRRSHARNSSGSSRSAAFRPAWKKRSRCCGSSRAQPCIVASNRSTRRISRAFEKQIQQKKLKKRKLQICGRGAVVRSRHFALCPKGPHSTGGAVSIIHSMTKADQQPTSPMETTCSRSCSYQGVRRSHACTIGVASGDDHAWPHMKR